MQSLYPLQTFHVQDAVTFVPLNAVNCSIKGFTGTMYSNLTDGTGSCTITLAAPDMVYQYWSVAKVGYQSQLSYTQLPDLINMTLAVVHDVTFIHSLDGTFLASGSVKANNTVTTYDHNEVITLSCVPAALYHFVNFSWDTGSSVVNNTAFTVTQNFTIWCYFSNQLVVALSSVPEIAANYSETTYSLTGSTPSTIEIAAGAVNFTVLTITYAPNSSYLWTFDYWLVNSTDIYDTYSILFTISGDTSLAIVYSGSGVPPSFEFLYPHDAILQTLYFRSDTWTILDQLGYKLQTVNTNTPASDSRYDADTKDVTYGFRVYYIDYLNNTGELTVSEPEALMVKTTNTSSMMTAYWNCPATTALVSAIEIRVYQKFNDEEWSLRVILISKSDLLWKLPAATWTFNLFMSRVEGSTNSTMWFGSSTYASSVALQYFRADPWEAAMARLYQLDLFGFMMMPWMYWLPDLFYGLVMLFIVVTSIIYHNTVKVILAEFWIFGGAGSILWAMIPPLGLHLAVIFLAVAMGWSLMRLFYGKRY
ncbi:MAG: hypothetical protein LAN71_17465 [Acidobacteriia bacterium]|nr:hypothetical protein [Terriglobia bacterium]